MSGLVTKITVSLMLMVLLQPVAPASKTGKQSDNIINDPPRRQRNDGSNSNRARVRGMQVNVLSSQVVIQQFERGSNPDNVGPNFGVMGGSKDQMVTFESMFQKTDLNSHISNIDTAKTREVACDEFGQTCIEPRSSRMGTIDSERIKRDIDDFNRTHPYEPSPYCLAIKEGFQLSRSQAMEEYKNSILLLSAMNRKIQQNIVRFTVVGCDGTVEKLSHASIYNDLRFRSWSLSRYIKEMALEERIVRMSRFKHRPLILNSPKEHYYLQLSDSIELNLLNTTLISISPRNKRQTSVTRSKSSLAHSCPRVEAAKGHIEITPETYCMVWTDYAMVNGTFGVVPGRWYGKIQVDCGPQCSTVKNNILLSCDGCIFCTHDEMIKECQAFVVPLILSIACGILIVLVLWLLLFKVSSKYFDGYLIDYLVRKAQIRREHRDRKTIELMMKVNMKPTAPEYIEFPGFKETSGSDEERMPLGTPEMENELTAYEKEGMKTSKAELERKGDSGKNTVIECKFNPQTGPTFENPHITSQKMMIWGNPAECIESYSGRPLMNENIIKSSPENESPDKKKSSSPGEIFVPQKKTYRGDVKAASELNTSGEPSQPVYPTVQLSDLKHEMEMASSRVSSGEGKPHPNLTIKPLVIPRKPSSSKLKKTNFQLVIMFVSILFSLFTNGLACDTTYFITSENRVCTNMDCVGETVTLMVISTGQTICFKTIDDDSFKISLKNSEWQEAYAPMYYTSDFKLPIESYSRCDGAGECSVRACYPNDILSKMKPKSKISDGGCYFSTGSCEGGPCTHGQHCTWYRWSLKQTGPLATVHVPINSGWRAELVTLSKEGLSTQVLDSTSNTRLPGSTSAVVSSAQFHNEGTYENLICIDSFCYLSSACDIDQPVEGILGDYQISLDKETEVFPENSIQCREGNCRVLCSYSQSGFNRSLTRANLTRIDTTLSDGLRMTKKPIKLSLSLLFNRDHKKEISVDKADCEIDIITVTACTGCKELPQAVLRPKNIRTQGILAIESNCSLSTNFIPCVPIDTLVEIVTQSATDCDLRLPGINKTLHLRIDYTFEGGLTRMQTMTSLSAWEKTTADMALLFKNPTFLDSMKFTAGIGAGLIVISKIIALILTYKQSRSVAKENCEAERM